MTINRIISPTHLDENVDDWYVQQTHRVEIDNFSDLSIMSDGIFTFKTLNAYKKAPISDEEILNHLIFNTGDHENNMLKKKVLKLKAKYNIAPTDDLTIIRLIREE